MINKNNSSVSAVYKGDGEIIKIYKGEDIVYQQTHYNYVLNVDDPDNFTYAGGTNTYSIQSFKESDSGVRKAVAWTAKYSTNGGSTWTTTKPSWLTTFTASAAGGTDYTSYNAKVAAQTSSSSKSLASKILKNADAVTDYDLSLHDVQGNTTTRNTANCYMVHAPGTYKLPLVYGNAIKNGTTNSPAYNPSGTSGTNFLKPFLNHNESGITDPWLKNNSAAPDGASLIWQDVNGLISTVGIDGDYLTFEITSANIAEGNAVIAATKSGTVVWSWHIWVTPETFYDSLATIDTGSHTYTVAPVNLGWVNISNVTAKTYAGRSCLVKISQSETDGLEHTFIIKQLLNAPLSARSKNGYNTYYLWGRKDPEIPAADMTSNTMHEVYDISGSSVSRVLKSSSTSIGTTIKNPLTHYYGLNYQSPYTNRKCYNFWDGTNTSTSVGTNAVVKTIYDPCPPGFCVPTAGLYQYFYDNKKYMTLNSTSGQVGVLWTKSTPNVFFPATGAYITASTDVGYVGSTTYVWTASPSNQTTLAYFLYAPFSSTITCHLTADARGSARSVRPVVEE